MNAQEIIINERFDYSPYIPVFKKEINNAIRSTVGQRDLTPQGKVNDCFFNLSYTLEKSVLDPLLKANPLTVNNVKIRNLSISFKVTFPSPIGKNPVTRADIQKFVSKKFPNSDLSNAEYSIPQAIRSYIDFTKGAEFKIDDSAKNAYIKINIDGSRVYNYIFGNTDSESATASIAKLSNEILNMMMHEIRHFMQSTKVAANVGSDADLRKFYVGDKTKTNKQLYKTKQGYYLNTDEMDSWAANIAGEIKNTFGNDQKGIDWYLNVVTRGKTARYNNLPVSTTLDHYKDLIINGKAELNVDRQELWKKLIKNVYKDLQFYKTKEDVEEGWKQWAAGAALGAAALGAYQGAKQTAPDFTQGIGTKQITQQPVNQAQKNQIVGLISPNQELEGYLRTAAQQSGIVGIELAQFMAQMKHESSNFGSMKEVGSKKYFKKYAHKKSLGNTPHSTHDANRYVGRGFVQLTGKYNYEMASRVVGVDLVSHPELAADPANAVKIAIWWWNTKVKRSVNDFNDTTAVTKKINPGLKGLQDRHNNFLAYKGTL